MTEQSDLTAFNTYKSNYKYILLRAVTQRLSEALTSRVGHASGIEHKRDNCTRSLSSHAVAAKRV